MVLKEATVEIRKISIPLIIGGTATVEAPEYLTMADGPLVMRLAKNGHEIEMWAWDREPMVMATFMMVGHKSEDSQHSIPLPKGYAVTRHMGSLFMRHMGEGMVLHVLSLL